MPPGNDEPADPDEQADAEINDREVSGDTGQKAEESEAGRDAETEAAAGEKTEDPTGAAGSQGGAEKKRQ